MRKALYENYTLSDGRFNIKLPFAVNANIGNSFDFAYQKFLKLDNSLGTI